MSMEVESTHVDQYYTCVEHLQKVFRARARQYAFKANDQAEFAEWKTRTRARLWEIMGLDLMEKADLCPKCLSVEQKEGHRREKWLIQTEPDVWMPFYVLIPDSLKPGTKNAAVIATHGHGPSGKSAIVGRVERILPDGSVQLTKEGYGVDFVRRGYTVFCPDARGAGERRERFKQGDPPKGSSCEQINHMAIPLGLCLAGMMVWDLMRLTDYICTRDDIDPERIGCAGMSGGGMQVLYYASMDDRMKCAVTSGYFYGAEDSLLVLNENCSCNFIPHMWETCDMGDLGALMAPRPFLVESGLKDHLNGARGIENVDEQIKITEKAYQLFGAEDKLVRNIFDGPHMWNGAKTYDFADKYLKE